VLSDADRAVPCRAFRRAGNSVVLGRYYLIGVFDLTTRLGHSENVTIAAKEVSAPCRGRRWRSAIFGSNVRDYLAQFSFSLPGSRLKLGNTIINFQKLNHGWKLWSLIRALRKCDALAKLYVGGRIIVEDMRAPANSVL
jgi:hypothetical protein